MTYIESPIPTTYGNDARPIHSGLGVDTLLGDSFELITNSPCSVASQANNDSTTGNTTTSTSYDDASILWRFPFTWVRGRYQNVVRQLRIDLWASTSANTGTIQVCVSPAMRVIDNPPVWPDVAKESAAGAVTTTAGYISILVDEVSDDQCVMEVMGAPPDGEDRGGLIYYTTYVTVRARMLAAGTLTASRLTYTEHG